MEKENGEEIENDGKEKLMNQVENLATIFNGFME